MTRRKRLILRSPALSESTEKLLEFIAALKTPTDNAIEVRLKVEIILQFISSIPPAELPLTSQELTDIMKHDLTPVIRKKLLEWAQAKLPPDLPSPSDTFSDDSS